MGVAADGRLRKPGGWLLAPAGCLMGKGSGIPDSWVPMSEGFLPGESFPYRDADVVESLA